MRESKKKHTQATERTGMRVIEKKTLHDPLILPFNQVYDDCADGLTLFHVYVFSFSFSHDVKRVFIYIYMCVRIYAIWYIRRSTEKEKQAE